MEIDGTLDNSNDDYDTDGQGQKLIKGYEVLKLIDEIAVHQDFGHFKRDEYPETCFNKFTTVRVQNSGSEKRVYTTKELKSYFLEKSATFIDYYTEVMSVKFRIPYDLATEKWKVCNELIDIDLPPVVSMDWLAFFGEQSMNFNKCFKDDKYFMRMLVFPLGVNDVQRDKIIEKYKLKSFEYDEQNLKYINDIFNQEGHLLFDVTLRRAALRPIAMLKPPMAGMKYRDINLRIWIDNVPCYLF